MYTRRRRNPIAGPTLQQQQQTPEAQVLGRRAMPINTRNPVVSMSLSGYIQNRQIFRLDCAADIERK